MPRRRDGLAGAEARTSARQAAKIRAFEREIVSLFVDTADILGVPKSVAAIYGICFASIEPLSFADIHERLKISQGSISQGLRVLREMGALKVIGTFERRDYFAPSMELRKIASWFIAERLEKHLHMTESRLAAIKSYIEAEAHSRGEINDRVRSLDSWHGKSKALVPLLKTFLQLG